MAITILKKDVPLIILEKSPDLKNLYLGVGWELSASRVKVDIDLVVALVDSSNNLLDLVYYGKKKSSNSAVILSADNLTGAGDGDDEYCMIKLEALPANVHRVFICLNIHEANSRGQSFNSLNQAEFRMLNADTQEVFATIDVDNDFKNFTGVRLATVERNSKNQWQLTFSGEGASGNITQMLQALDVTNR
jgi:tellurium resistance protein TerD